jgi:hypothetical protein
MDLHRAALLLAVTLVAGSVSTADARPKGNAENKVKIDVTKVTSKGNARTAAPSRSRQLKLQSGSAQENMRN